MFVSNCYSPADVIEGEYPMRIDFQRLRRGFGRAGAHQDERIAKSD